MLHLKINGFIYRWEKKSNNKRGNKGNIYKSIIISFFVDASKYLVIMNILKRIFNDTQLIFMGFVWDSKCVLKDRYYHFQVIDVKKLYFNLKLKEIHHLYYVNILKSNVQITSK